MSTWLLRVMVSSLPLAPHVEFIKPLQDVEVNEKESAKFECEVSRESAKVSLSHLEGGSGLVCPQV